MIGSVDGPQGMSKYPFTVINASPTRYSKLGLMVPSASLNAYTVVTREGTFAKNTMEKEMIDSLESNPKYPANFPNSARIEYKYRSMTWCVYCLTEDKQIPAVVVYSGKSLCRKHFKIEIA